MCGSIVRRSAVEYRISDNLESPTRMIITCKVDPNRLNPYMRTFVMQNFEEVQTARRGSMRS